MKRAVKKISTTGKTRLVLTLGTRVTLAVQHGNEKNPVQTRIDLDNLIINFQEALDEPHTQYRLRDYCGEAFFKNRTKTPSKELYLQTQAGSVDGADAFVVYGAHVGALLANLEILYRPSNIALTGTLTAFFDVWSHSMGKARTKLLGSRPAHCVSVLNAKGEPLPLSSVKMCKRKTDARKRRLGTG
jgi:hypothetical protein